MRRRRLNTKFLLILLGVTAGVILSVFGIHHLQVHRNAGGLHTLAEQAQEQGDLKKAAGHLRTYVNLRPTDADGYAEWATVVDKIAQSPQATSKDIILAASVLEIAVRKSPERSELRRRLVEYNMQFDRAKDAKEHLDTLLKDQPQDTELRLQRGRCLVAMGQYEAAASEFYELIGFNAADRTFNVDAALAADNIDAYLTAAELMRLFLQSPELADLIMDQMASVNSESYRAYLERGRFRQRRGNTDGAQEDIARAIELAPDDVEVILMAVSLAAGAERFDEARAHLERGIKLYPKDDRIYQSLAVVELTETKDSKAALAHIEKGLEASPGSITLLMYQAHLQLQNRDLDAVRNTIEVLARSQVDPQRLDFLRTRILLVEEKWLEASRELERLRPLMAREPESILEIDLFLGQCYERVGQPDRALEAYRRARLANPNLQFVQEGIQRTMAAMGQGKSEARNPLEKALAEIMRLPKEKRDWSAVDSVLESHIAATQPTAAREAILRAEVAMMREDLAAAAKILAAASKQSPTETELWVASATLAQRQSQGSEAALRILSEAQKAVGDRIELRLTRALLLVQGGGDELGPALELLEQPAAGWSDADAARLWSGLLQFYVRTGLNKSAQRVGRRLADARPSDVQVRLTLFNLARDHGDAAAMKSITNEILNVTGTKEDSLWQYCEASRLLASAVGQQDKQAAIDEAQTLVTAALRSRPEWNELHRVQAMIHVLNEKYNEAVISFRRAFELGPVHPTAVRQLVQVLWYQGRFEEAQQALSLVPERQRGGILPELQAEILFRAGDVEGALRLADSAVRKNPQSHLVQLWHGQVLLRTDRIEAAERAFRRAVELKPEAPQGWISLIDCLHRQGQTAKVEAELARAQQLLPPEQVPLVTAQCNELLGNWQDAERSLLAALEKSPDDLLLLRSVARFYLSEGYRGPRGSQMARPYLERIANHAPGSSKGDDSRPWARRTLAPLVAENGAYPDLLKALELIEANAVDGKLEPEDMVQSATLLAGRPEAVSRRKAIRLLEQVHEQVRLGNREKLILAQLYYHTGDWTRCQQVMVSLTDEKGDNPLVLVTYCEMLLEKDLLDQADRWIHRLEELEGQATPALRLRVRLLGKQGKSPEATKLLLASLPEELTKADLPKVIGAVQLLQLLEQHDDAERLLRRYADVEPQGSLALAQFIGKQRSVDEAFRLIETSAKTQPLPLVIQVAIDVIRHRRDEIGDRYDSQVEDWLEQSIRSNPESGTVLMQRAAFADLCGKYEVEEQCYRRVLALEKLSHQERSVALNNLAFSLALRKKTPKEGVQLIKDAIAISGPTGALLDTRAMVNFASGDFDRAISDLNLAIADQPKATRYFHLAVVQLAKGNKQGAYQALTEAQRRGLKVDDISALEKPYYDRLVDQVGSQRDAQSREPRAVAR